MPAGHRRLPALLVPPVVALVASNLFYWMVANHYGFNYFLARTHARWDSGNYATIAREGYSLFHCVPGPKSPFSAADWCGTAAWFPLYPLMMRGLNGLGLTLGQAGLLVTELCTLGLFLLLWWLLGARLSVRNLGCLALAAVFPGSIYYHAVFPISLTLLAALACLMLVVNRRWVLAGFAGAVSAAAYQSGVLLALVVLAWMAVTQRQLGWRAWVGRAVQTSTLICLGLFLVMAVQQLHVGHWNAFVMAERKYGTGLNNPIDTIKRNTFRQVDPPRPGYDPTKHLPSQRAPRTQFLLATLVVTLAAVATVVRGQVSSMDWAILLYTLATWGTPLIAGGHIALYRTHALLLPCVVLLRHLPRFVILLLAVPAGVVAWQIATLFYRYILI